MHALVRECQAYVSLKDHQGTTALHWAAGGGRLLTMAKLVKEFGGAFGA